jgi:hypothetical protein
MDSFQVMYNDQYGGFRFSELAINEYKKKSIFEYSDSIDRTDPIMINICKNLGCESNSIHSNIKIKEIPTIYKNYYSIKEYDGKEHIKIDYQRYQLDCIKNIINADYTNDEKIAKIKTVL